MLLHNIDMERHLYSQYSRLTQPNELELLRPDECEFYSQTIIGHRQHWKPRDSRVGFYTLGTPAYLDASESIHKYCQIAQENNIIVMSISESLLEQVLRCICEMMQLKQAWTRHLPETAYPGFHIFYHTEITSQARTTMHRDMQFQKIRPLITRILEGVTDKRIIPISFTVALRLPLSGGGLKCRVSDGAVKRFKYEAGRLYLHDGLCPHKIDDEYKSVRGDYRITLQGHGVITTDGRFYYYW